MKTNEEKVLEEELTNAEENVQYFSSFHECPWLIVVPVSQTVKESRWFSGTSLVDVATQVLRYHERNIKYHKQEKKKYVDALSKARRTLSS